MDGLSTSTFLYKRCILCLRKCNVPCATSRSRHTKANCFFAITQYPTQTNAKKGWQFFVQQSVSLFRGFLRLENMPYKIYVPFRGHFSLGSTAIDKSLYH